MIVAFTKADLSEMERLGCEKLANANRLGTPHINRFRQDRIEGYVDGFKGEWAVADALGIPRDPNVTGRADDGADVRLPDGAGINVRFTPYKTGKLMCPANRPIKAKWAVLVVGTDDPMRVRIIGGVSTRKFYEFAHTKDFGYGETRFMEQDELTPWEKIAQRYLPS
jgi:hypothetical protein